MPAVQEEARLGVHLEEGRPRLRLERQNLQQRVPGQGGLPVRVHQGRVLVREGLGGAWLGGA